MVDLMAPDNGDDDDGDDDSHGLDEDALEVLKEAGVIAGPSKRRKTPRTPKHIIFAETEAEGALVLPITVQAVFNVIPIARKQASTLKAKKHSSREEKQTASPSIVDLGWRSSENKMGKRRKEPSEEEEGD